MYQLPKYLKDPHPGLPMAESFIPCCFGGCMGFTQRGHNRCGSCGTISPEIWVSYRRQNLSNTPLTPTHG